jgi:hypothetical protein
MAHHTAATAAAGRRRGGSTQNETAEALLAVLQAKVWHDELFGEESGRPEHLENQTKTTATAVPAN